MDFSHAPVPAANKALCALVGEGIILEENDIPLRKRNYFHEKFRLNVRRYFNFLAGTSASVEVTGHSEEVVIEFIQPDKAEQQRESAKRMYDAQEPEFKIAEVLGVSRSWVTKLINEVFELRGEKKPDGRSRRSKLAVKHKEPPPYQAIAERVMKLFRDKKRCVEIPTALEIDRNMVTKFANFWHEQRGLPVPDGRTRRKSL